jgi:hypothetical protein
MEASAPHLSPRSSQQVLLLLIISLFSVLHIADALGKYLLNE